MNFQPNSPRPVGTSPFRVALQQRAQKALNRLPQPWSEAVLNSSAYKILSREVLRPSGVGQTANKSYIGRSIDSFISDPAKRDVVYAGLLLS